MSPGNRRVSITVEAKNQASRVFRQLQADINATNTASSNLSKTTAAGTRSLEGWTGALLKGRDAAKTTATVVGNLHSEMIVLGVAQRGLNNALNATAISQGRAAINLERLEISLRTISGSTEAATAQYERLIEVARLPGINLNNALRASLQLQAIGKSGEEATTIISEFGNAFALAGGSGQQLTGVVHGIRQIISDGKVLQRELNIITSRIAILTPIMEQAFGGNRAEDVRAFAESIGRGDDTVGVFFEAILAGLRELPRAGNTAANAIENLFDTTERAQASIGRNFLPIIRETTSALEGLAARIEKNPQLARTIALFETFAGTLGTVAVAIAGVGVALRFLGPALIATFTNPIGLAALAVGGLAAAVLTWRVATQTAQQPLRDLNPLIERNTALINRNRRATEENNRTELQSTGQSLQDAIGEIQRRIESIRQAGAEAQGVLARLDERLQNLQGSRGRQTSQLAVRVDEEFDDAFIAARGFAEELTKAESELQRLTDAAGETDAITDGFKEADQAAESLRDTIRKLGTEISEGASTDSLSASLAGRNVNPQTLLRDLVDVQDTLNQLSETYDDIASNAANSTEAQAHLTEIQGVLTGATERYLNALSQSLTLTLADTDAKESEFEEIQRLAQGYVDYYQGRGDAFQAYVNRADGLAERATAAIGRLDLAEQAEDAQDEAEQALEAFTRNRERAAQRAVQAEAAAARERAQSQRANLRLGEQLDRAATEIFKEQLKERTDANQDAIEAQLDARKEAAKEREAAADRVADREAQRREDEVRETEKAEKEKTRIAERESRQRTRQAQREARELQRVFGTDFASGLADAFDSDLIGDTVLGSLRAVESDITAFLTDTFSIGTLAGFNAAVPFIQTFFRGLFESITRPDLTVPEHERTPSITEAQLAQGQFGQTRQDERFFNEFGSQFRLGDFGSLGDIGPLDVNILGVPDVLKRDPLTKNDLIDIYNRYGIPHNLERTAENTKGTALNTKDTARRVGQLFVVNKDDGETIRQILRDTEDTPLANLLANEQGLLRIFGAEQTATFLVGANNLIKEQEEFLRQQRRSQDPEFALVDDLELLLRTAEVESAGAISTPEIDALLTTLRESLALDEGLTSEAAISALTDLRSLLSRANVLAETTDAFTRRFFDEFIQDGLEITVGEIPEAIRVAVDTEGVLLNVDPDAVVGFDAEGALVAVDPEAEVGVEETELPVQETEQPVEEKEQPIDPNAEVPVDTEGKTVDVDTADKTIPIGDLPEGTLIPIEALPPGTVVPIEDLPADVQIQFAGVPEGTLIPIEKLPPGTLIPIQALPPELVIPFAGVPADTEIGVEDTSEREIAVEETSDRTIQVEIVVPTTETPAGETLGTDGGQVQVERPIDTGPGGAGRPRPASESDVMHGHVTDAFQGTPRSGQEIANIYSPGETEILSRIGETDAALPISQESLAILLGEGSPIAQGISDLATQQQMPVDLTQGSGELIANTIAGKTLTVGPAGGAMAVEGDVSAEVRGRVQADVGRPRVAGIDETVNVRGEMRLAGGEVLEVRITNVSDFANQIFDAVDTAPPGDFDDRFTAG